MSYKGLDIYILSIELSDLTWEIYKALPQSLKFSLGDQLQRSTDSVGANIAEGYGRYYYADSLRFYYHARGSLYESEHWVELIYKRNLITKEMQETFKNKVKVLGIKINNYIKAQKEKMSIKVNEPMPQTYKKSK